MPSGPRPPIPPGLAKLVLQGTILGHQARCVFGLSLAGSSIGTSDINSLLGSIDTSYLANLRTMQSTDWVRTGWQCVYVPSVGAERVGNFSGASAGTLAGTTVADAGCSYVLNWTIEQYYRGGHPRTYLPGVVVGDVTNGSALSSARRSALVTQANLFLNAVNALTTTNITAVQLGTISYAHNKAWRTPPTFVPYKGATVASFIGSQRRRIHS